MHYILYAPYCTHGVKWEIDSKERKFYSRLLSRFSLFSSFFFSPPYTQFSLQNIQSHTHSSTTTISAKRKP